MAWANLACVTWGVLAFGAVYPWAYWPLLLACAGVGAVNLLRAGRKGDPRLSRPLAAGLFLFALAVGAQLLPLSRATIRALTPGTDALLRQYDLLYAAGAAGEDAEPRSAAPDHGRDLFSRQPVRHPVSIEPRATALGLAFVVGLGVFLLGNMTALSRRDIRVLTTGLVALGLLVALIAIVQNALTSGRVYGFWRPMFGRNPFGPFVNRNHFAGWMLMALPLAIGYVCALVARGGRGIHPAWRNRILWLGSPEANGAILGGAAVIVMALSLVLSMSRSGIACFLAGLTVLALGARRRRAILTAYLLLVAFVAMGRVGIDAISSRAQQLGETGFHMRLEAWQDAWRVARRFPVTGTGLNTYGTAMLFHQTVWPEYHYGAAHSDYLQLAAEGGVLLGAPVLLLLLLFVREVRLRFRERAEDDSDSWIRLGAATGLVAIALQEAVEFSLQMPGNAVLFTVLCAIAVRPSSGQGGLHAPIRNGAPQGRRSWMCV